LEEEEILNYADGYLDGELLLPPRVPGEALPDSIVAQAIANKRAKYDFVFSFLFFLFFLAQGDSLYNKKKKGKGKIRKGGGTNEKKGGFSPRAISSLNSLRTNVPCMILKKGRKEGIENYLTNWKCRTEPPKENGEDLSATANSLNLGGINGAEKEKGVGNLVNLVSATDDNVQKQADGMMLF
jgi:hypothetical protein